MWHPPLHEASITLVTAEAAELLLDVYLWPSKSDL